MITVTAAELQNNFAKYLKSVQDGEEIMILEDDKEIARLISRDAVVSSIAASLTGILKHEYDEEEMRAERIEKHEGIGRYKRAP